MEKIDWKDFRFQDSKINQKTGKEYFQEYLCPSLYVEIYLDYTEHNYMEEFYQGVINKIGHLFNYHADNKNPREVLIKHKKEAFNIFTDFLQSSKTHIWRELSDVGGSGSSITTGGVGEASFSCWIHKKPKTENHKQERAQTIENYKSVLQEYQTDMLPSPGTIISNIKICLPVDTFSSSEEFLQWILSFQLINTCKFFSGSAGYKISFFKGYENAAAEKKLEEILTDYPGFDYDISIGNSMGRLLNKEKGMFVPQFKRINWLTLINEDGVELLGGVEKLEKEISINKSIKIHKLKYAIVIQAGEYPRIGKEKADLENYYFIGKLLASLHYKKHDKDKYFIPKDPVAKEWMYKFD